MVAAAAIEGPNFAAQRRGRAVDDDSYLAGEVYTFVVIALDRWGVDAVTDKNQRRSD